MNDNILGEMEISKNDALKMLVEVYLARNSTWYQSLIATLVGFFAIPVLALNIQITNPTNFGYWERSFFSIISLGLLLVILYFISKVIYSNGLLQHIFEDIEIAGINRNLSQMLIKRKYEWKGSVWISKLYKFSNSPGKSVVNITLFLHILLWVLGIFSFLLIWWEYEFMLKYIIAYATIYILIILSFFKRVIIL